MNRILTATLLLLAALPPVVSGQIPPGYYVQQVTNNNIREAGPRVNDRGQIVYEARLDGSDESGEIFLYDSRSDQTTRITNDNVRDAFPDINSDGVLTWTRFIGPDGEFGPTGEIMIRDPDGTVTRLTDNAVEDRSPRINGTNHVAWKRYMGPGCGGATMDILFFDGSTTEAITTNGVTDDVINQAVNLNALDQIVWTEYDFCVNPWESRVLLYSDGMITQLSSPEMFAPQAADINGHGQVTWKYHDLNTNEHRIVMWESGETRFVTLGRGPLLNDLGQVAFSRWHNDVQAWQGWLYRDGRDWRLTDDAVWNLPWDINRLGEVVWRADAIGASDIHYLRRFSLGDLNCDNVVNAFDIEPFLLALFEPNAYSGRYPECDIGLADIDGNGTLDAFDIEPFLYLLFP